MLLEQGSTFCATTAPLRPTTVLALLLADSSCSAHGRQPLQMKGQRIRTEQGAVYPVTHAGVECSMRVSSVQCFGQLTDAMNHWRMEGGGGGGGGMHRDDRKELGTYPLERVVQHGRL